MYYLSRYCFICLNNDEVLYKIIQKDKRNEIAKEMEYVIPELTNIKSEIPLYVCSICQNTVDLFYTFKKMCIENYFRFKQYTYLLQGAHDTRKHKYKELQIRIQSKQVETVLKNQKRRAKELAEAKKKKQKTKKEKVNKILVTDTQNNKNDVINYPDIPDQEEVREELQKIKQEFEKDEQVKTDHNYAVRINSKKYTEIEQIHCIKCKKWYKIFTLQNNSINKFSIKEFFCLDCHKKLIDNYNLTKNSTQTEIIEENEIKKEIIEDVNENNKNLEQENDNIRIKEENMEEQNDENGRKEDKNNENNDKNNKEYKNNEPSKDQELGEEQVKTVPKKKQVNKRKNSDDNTENIIGLLSTFKKKKQEKILDKNETVDEIKDLLQTAEEQKEVIINDFELEIKKNIINTKETDEKIKKAIDDPGNILENSDVLEYIRVEDKQFICLLCNQTFTKKSYAVLHLKNHLGIKEFKCTKCEKSFALKHNLNAHLKNHVGNCKVCKKFIGENELARHRCAGKKQLK